MAIDQCGPAGELADFGEKLTRSLIDHRRDVTEAVALANRDMPGQDDEHPRSGLAGLEQSFAILVTAQLAEAAHARDLWWRQRRECLLETRKPGRQRSTAIRFTSSHPVHTDLRLTPSGTNKTCRGPNPAICPVFFR